MNGPQSNRSKFGIDGVLILIGVIGVAAALYFLLQDNSLKGPTQGELKAVGKVALSQKDVRRRIQSGFTWSSIGTSDEVFEGDSIFTGEESEAAINLNTGGQIKIDPRSLIVVKTLGKRLQLDLQYGSLTGRIGSTPLAFYQNGQLQEITGDGAEIRIDNVGADGEAKISVLKGEVQIKSTSAQGATGVNTVRENEVLELHPSRSAPVVKKQQFELTAPQNNKTLWLPPGQPLAFTWRQVAKVTNGSNKFEISKDPNFTSLLVSEETQASQIQVPAERLPTGVFHWRVRPTDPVDASRVLPAVAKLTVFPDLPPLPKFPQDQQEFSPDPDKENKSKQVELMWEDNSGSTEYEVQLASDENFSTVIASEKVKKNNHITPALTTGEYYWRVRGTHPERANPPWSRVMRFTVAPEAVEPGAPVLAKTWIKYEIPTSVLNRAPANVSVEGQGVAPEDLESFQWSEVENAESYEVEIASTTAFVNSIKHSVGKELSFAPQEVKPGSLYVRVRAIGRKGLQSPPSQIGRLEVILPPPILKSVPDVVDKFKSKEELEKGKHEFQLSWTSRPFAESYELEWGSDATFKRSKKFRLKNNHRTITVTQPSDYAARVRALGPGGIPISPFSPVQVASYKKELDEAALKLAAAPTPPPAPKKPASVDPKSQKLKGTPGPTLREPLRDSSFIAMEGSVPYVNFRWKAVPKASHYEIQLAEDADFVNVVGTYKAQSTRYTLQFEVPEGRVYWRVRAIIKGKPTEWSQVRDINVLYQ